MMQILRLNVLPFRKGRGEKDHEVFGEKSSEFFNADCVSAILNR